jgi:hypothetical protein
MVSGRPQPKRGPAEVVVSQTQVNFVRQQGFGDAPAGACDLQYSALMFQPRVIGVLVLAALLLQAPYLFLALSAVLWWNVLMPSQNPFDGLYNTFIARRRQLPLLTAAPAPRRFAQGMAATFMLAIGVSLLAGWNTVAWVLEGLLLFALGALIFAGFCLGSYIFHLISGRSAFANRTLPWSRGA